MRLLHMKQKIAFVLSILLFALATAYCVTLPIFGVVPVLHWTLWSLQVVCFTAIQILLHCIRKEKNL